MLDVLEKQLERMQIRTEWAVLPAPHTIEVGGIYLLGKEGDSAENVEWMAAYDTYHSLLDELFARLLPTATVLSQSRHRLELLLDADVPTAFEAVVNNALAPYLGGRYSAALYTGDTVLHDLVADDLTYEALRGRAEEGSADVLFYTGAPCTVLLNQDAPPVATRSDGWYEGLLSYDLRLTSCGVRMFRITGIKNLSDPDENR